MILLLFRGEVFVFHVFTVACYFCLSFSFVCGVYFRFVFVCVSVSDQN